MRILVTGSRNWRDENAIANALIKATNNVIGPHLVMHGGARGADSLAGKIASGFGWWVEVYVADWKTHGRAAGCIRNQVMIERRPDIVLAFLMPDSRGTRDMIRRAEKARVPVQIFL